MHLRMAFARFAAGLRARQASSLAGLAMASWIWGMAMPLLWQEGNPLMDPPFLGSNNTIVSQYHYWHTPYSILDLEHGMILKSSLEATNDNGGELLRSQWCISTTT